ncbi:hypothetical protein DFS33DRAFT_1309716 [Desarmillaria ectypa]|nr:hypothetical protein DFS33DRAFT_1309716 [Desarmillaria ectypa]
MHMTPKAHTVVITLLSASRGVETLRGVHQKAAETYAWTTSLTIGKQESMYIESGKHRTSATNSTSFQESVPAAVAELRPMGTTKHEH